MTIKRRKLNLNFFIEFFKALNGLFAGVVYFFVLVATLHYFVIGMGNAYLGRGFLMWIFYTAVVYICYTILLLVKKNKENKLK